MHAALAELDACDAATVLTVLSSKLDAIQASMEELAEGMKVLLGRSAPQSSCAFCTVRKTVMPTSRRGARGILTPSRGRFRHQNCNSACSV
ncbi:unnamed protein product [Nippostrongylus brasiliensis]|uniref:Histidine kinase n=1 Tax=Nippostrongylus brasiliensis TaxID=27835 RepID=A0A0N4XWT7_NIPBR|nr:unnamed protein product [Nippostrongylus brasiliensis]